MLECRSFCYAHFSRFIRLNAAITFEDMCLAIAQFNNVASIDASAIGNSGLENFLFHFRPFTGWGRT